MRRMSSLAIVALFAFMAAGCGPLLAHAQALSLTYARGDVHMYKIHMTSDFAENYSTMPRTDKIDLTATETVTVQSVDSAGVADVTVSLTKVTMTMTIDAGQSKSTTTTTTDVPTISLRIGRDGRVLGTNGTNLGSAFLGGISGPSLATPVLPDNAVKPGDSWSKDYDQAVPKEVNQMGSGSVHVSSKSKYLRDEMLKGVNSAVIETTSALTINFTFDNKASPISGGPSAGAGSVTLKGTVNSVTTSWIDPSAHRMLKSQMHSTYTMTTSVALPPQPSLPIPVTSIDLKGSQQLNLDPA